MSHSRDSESLKFVLVLYFGRDDLESSGQSSWSGGFICSFLYAKRREPWSRFVYGQIQFQFLWFNQTRSFFLVIQESQWSGKVLGYFNMMTHIALISKKQVDCPFEDFKPISCCNTIYKILAKVMAPCLEPILSEVISKEQSGFFQGRQIRGVNCTTIYLFGPYRKSI